MVIRHDLYECRLIADATLNLEEVVLCSLLYQQLNLLNGMTANVIGTSRTGN